MGATGLLTSLTSPVETAAGSRSTTEEARRLPLTYWITILDRHLDARHWEAAVVVLRALLVQRPLHLPAYERALALTWQMGRYRACESMALRLLRADPLNRMAYTVLASLAERRTGLQGEETIPLWQTVWHLKPLDPEIRQRWQAVCGNLELDQPALGFLRMYGRHWSEAAALFAHLSAQHPERVDWRLAWLISLWRSYQRAQAWTMARTLVDRNRYLLACWHILSVVGDQADQAIAQTYIAMLDPDGSHTRHMLGFEFVPVGSTVPELEVDTANTVLMHCLDLEE